MKLGKSEEEICKKYRKRDADGFVHCAECPLVIDRGYCECKASITDGEWRERWNSEL